MEEKKPKVTQLKLKRNPSWKNKTAPVVRQTLTSFRRMLKANPLMLLEDTSTLGLESNSTVAKARSNLQLEPIENLHPKLQPQDVSKINSTGAAPKVIISNVAESRPIKNLKDSSSDGKILSKKSLKAPVEIKSKVNSFRKPTSLKSNNVGLQKHVSVNKNDKMRRSRSFGDLQTISEENQVVYKKTYSIENLHAPVQRNNVQPIIPKKNENHSVKEFVFKTPTAHERRSVCRFTPTSTIKKASSFQSSTPFATHDDRLQEALNQWLKLRGKKLTSFNHLRCFGIHNVKKNPESNVNEENKENVEIIQAKSNSYENLHIVHTPEGSTKITPEENLESIAKDAIKELHALINEDYPTLQCFGWLALIRDKCKKIVESPEYWECRAAIEQSAGNVENAVEFYKTAIVQGAEVHTVDKSLDQLLKKFSLLNISPEKSDVVNIDKGKERIVREARNVFKSTIIQFAIQERKLKKQDDDKKYIVTPVRRSTRLSRSSYIATPGVKLCMSLKEIDTNDNIDFQTNKALC